MYLGSIVGSYDGVVASARLVRVRKRLRILFLSSFLELFSANLRKGQCGNIYIPCAYVVKSRCPVGLHGLILLDKAGVVV